MLRIKFNPLQNNKFFYTPTVDELKINSKLSDKDNKVAKVMIKDTSFTAEFGKKFQNNRSGIVVHKNNKDYFLLNKLSNGQFIFSDSSKIKDALPNSYYSITDLSNTWKDNLDDYDGFTWKENIQTIQDNAFEDCSSLTEVSIPGTVTQIGNTAFNNCASLQLAEFNSSVPPTIGNNIFNNCDNLTTIKVPDGSEDKYAAIDQLSKFFIKPYLMFKSTAALSINCTKAWNGTLEYSIDNKTWDTFTGTKITSNTGLIYMRGTGNTKLTSGPWTFTTTGKLSCVGNIENLLDYQTVSKGQHPSIADSCFAVMFLGCTSLVLAPNLPITTLSQLCYSAMFQNCTALTAIPALPATTLTKACYAAMFQGCTNLSGSITLPAVSLMTDCYSYMFASDTKISEIHLPETVKNNSYLTNFPGSNCSATIYYDL